MISGAFRKIPAIRLLRFSMVLIAIVLFGLSAVAYAEEITYTGNGKNLRDNPSWFSEEAGVSVFPSSEKAPLSSGNKVTIDYDPEAAGVRHPEFVCGGMSMSGKVTGNTVILLNGRVDLDISAGDSRDGDTLDNKVSMSGGSVGKSVYSGFSDRGNVTSNDVVISGGVVGEAVHGGFSGGGTVAGNTVTMSGGSVGILVAGGMSSGNVTHNTVVVSGGVVGEGVLGGYSDGGTVAGNTVTMSGGSVGILVAGGMNSGNVTHNTVAVSGGSVGEGVLGGYSTNGSATDNTVTISGKPDVAKARIYGGYTACGEGNTITGNTLNCKSSGISAEGVSNFEYYNFCLPENLAAGAVMLSVTEEADLKGTIVGISLQGGLKLKKGDKIALIRSSEGVKDAPKNKHCQVKHDGALYEFSIYTDKNNLWAEVTNISSPAE